MKILYVTISFPKENEGGNIYTDLAEELAQNNDITVLVAEEKKKIAKNQINKERNMEVIRVKVGNMYNVSLIEKAISYITIPHLMIRAIKKQLKNREYDIVVYTVPPVTVEKIVKYAKKKFKCISYLMQKDIFPQNAVDIGIMKKNSLEYIFFKNKEKSIYKISDRIGCMSEGNMKYIVQNNKNIKNIEEKVELFPNTIKIKNIKKDIDKNKIKEKFKIPKDKVIALYGGNFGKPQGIDFIIDVLNEYKNSKKIFFIFSGKGTEKQKLFEYINKNNITNVLTIEYIPREEYEELLQVADIGLIFLDRRFTIPNIPSRLLTYLEYEVPILAATDKNTDLKDILRSNKIGLWCEAGDIKEFTKQLNFYINYEDERIKIGLNGRKYLEQNLTTAISANIIDNAYREYKNMKKGEIKNV